jgi:hypothetical protein
MEAGIRAILDDGVSPRQKIGLGSMLAAIGRDFDGVPVIDPWAPVSEA